MRVLVVEDEKKVASLLRSGLEEQGYTVVECYDGDAALKALLTQSFDAVVLDIMIPGPDGLSVLRQLREKGMQTPALLLSARGSLNERIEGLDVGADDYLAKPFAMSELQARLRAILRRKNSEHAAVYSCADLVLNLATREARRAGQRIELTPREFSLLECLLRAQGRVKTRTELSQEVWAYQFDPGTNVVDVAIQRLRRKIDENHDEKLIHTVRGLGYSLRTES